MSDKLSRTKISRTKTPPVPILVPHPQGEDTPYGKEQIIELTEGDIVSDESKTPDLLGDQNQKKDAGKTRWSLFPWKGAEWIVRVLGFGAKKYRPGGWRTVDNAIERYGDAAARHLAAYLAGEVVDPESGLPHLAHLGCCTVFLLELDKRHQ